jgi:glyoxylase-like metal-dependent hydrolase (beta-lactamase superfamily II)
MFRNMFDVLREGDEFGNGMIVRIELTSGLKIFGLATKNFYAGEWDLGPTWNYLVLADSSFLVDTGRSGMAGHLLEMIEDIGFSSRDIEFILLSHGHEDHDGGASHIQEKTGARVRAHSVYDQLIRFSPDKAPENVRKDFPPSCWHCPMPESFSGKHCVQYHRERNGIVVEVLEGESCSVGENIRTYHLPGHSPDAIAVSIVDEAIVVGDNVLPDISPIPTREEFFDQVSRILKPEYSEAQALYGLRAYIRSLKRLRQIGERLSGAIILPAHRLFYKNRWNLLDLEERIDELIAHHMQRCAEILRILREKPRTCREIVLEHFDESLLKGTGIHMAENEILSHLELLEACEDITRRDESSFAATGSNNFDSLIQSIEPA